VKATRPNVGDYPYGELHCTALIFIGLKQSTSLTNKEIAKFFLSTEEKIDRFERQIMENREGQYAMKNGMPSSLGEHLFFGHVRCRQCRAKLNRVPCLTCCKVPFAPVRGFDDTKKLVPCQIPTNAPAGSMRKIAIMRARIEIGMEPFSDFDDENATDCQLESLYPAEVRTAILQTETLYRELKRELNSIPKKRRGKGNPQYAAAQRIR
jgi:hypothetical protein